MIVVRKIASFALGLSLLAGTAASSTQFTGGVATVDPTRAGFINIDEETAVSQLASTLSSAAGRAAQTVADAFDMQAALREAEAAFDAEFDATTTVDKQEWISNFVAGKLAPLLADAVADAIAAQITLAAVSPEIAAKALDLASIGRADGMGTMTITAAVMNVMTGSFGYVFGGNGTNGLGFGGPAGLQIINTALSSSINDVRTVVQTVLINNPTPPQVETTGSTGETRGPPVFGGPPTTVIVVYRG